MLYRYRSWGQMQKTKTIPDPKLFVSHFIFIQFKKKLKHIEFVLNYVELLICGKNRPMCFRTSICRIHCIDQSKTFTLFLKSKILDFETLSHVHVYRIEYVSYRQCPYRYGWWPYRPSPSHRLAARSLRDGFFHPHQEYMLDIFSCILYFI